MFWLDSDLRQKSFNMWLSISLILWMSDLCSLIVWPTTKMASALPDFLMFDSAHFKTWFFDGPTYGKIGLRSLWFSKNEGVHFFGRYSIIVWHTTKMASALLDFSMFYWVHFKTWFIDGPTYDEIGLWSLRFSIIDWVHVLARFWPTTKMALALPLLIFQFLIEYILRLDSLTVQPTAKLAFGLSDFQKMTKYIFFGDILYIEYLQKKCKYILFDWIHFSFFEDLTYILW